MTTRHVRSCFFLLALLTVSQLATGCVTSGRRILLKEYGATIPVMDNAGLQGKVICLEDFTSVPDLMAMELTTKPEEPEPYSYTVLSKEHDDLWSAEMKQLGKSSPKSEWIKVGNLRNGFGMVMSHAYALNDPAQWLRQSLRLDLEAQGAKVVDASRAAEADVTVAGIILLCRADMYLVVNGSLVVDLTVTPKTGPPRRREIHTHGATAAMLASTGEYFHALRDARQKFSILAIREISQALQASP